MGSVWKRIQRVGKKAAKFEFFVQLQSLTVECKKEKKWVPSKLTVLWQRGQHRRRYSRPFDFQPGIAKPYRGVMVWAEPEELETVCTLYKDDKPDAPFEPKEWTFIILDESSGRKKPIAQGVLDMAKFATIEPSCKTMPIKLKPGSIKVSKAQLDIALHCVFLREGKATDEDMLSIASMMSLNEMDDFDFDDDNRAKRMVPSGASSSTIVSANSAFNDSGTSSIGDSSLLSNSTTESASPKSRQSSLKKSPRLSHASTKPKMEIVPNSGQDQQQNITSKTNLVENFPKTNANEASDKVEGSEKNEPEQVHDLLEWAQNITAGHRGVKVTNMTTSWRSGLAFCAVLHHFHPELVDFSSLSPHNIKENNKLAFDAFDYLGIPKILDPNDMVRAATPDKLTVMTYLHQIKHHFETQTLSSSINTLVSQYKFMSTNDDLLTAPTKPASKMSKLSGLMSPSKHWKSKPAAPAIEKPKLGVTLSKEVEIDEISDDEEINCIFQKMQKEEKRKTVETIDSSMKKQMPQTSVSIDEDEMLNQIIGDGNSPSKETEKPVFPVDPIHESENSFDTSKNMQTDGENVKNDQSEDLGNSTNPFLDDEPDQEKTKVDEKKPFLDEIDSTNSNSNQSEVEESVKISDLKYVLGHKMKNGDQKKTQDSETTNPFLSDEEEPPTADLVEEDLKPKKALRKIPLSPELKISTIESSPSISEHIEIPADMHQNKQEQIQERARRLINEARQKAQQLYDESQLDAETRAAQFMNAQKERDRVLQERLAGQEGRKKLLRLQASELLKDVRAGEEQRSSSPLSDRAASPENSEVIDQKDPEFKKNPFKLVKKKTSLKALPTEKFVKEKPNTKTNKNEMESLVESRKVNLDSFSTYQQKPKRDVAAEVAAELARLKNTQEKEKDVTDSPQKVDSGEEEEEEEDIEVPVDDYYYELENFHFRSVDEYFNLELVTLEKETKALDQVAQKLEVELRKAMADGLKEEEKDLLQEWFNLVNKKNNIIRRQDEIAFLAQADDLENQCDMINRELRVLSTLPESEKTEETHRREEHLVNQLVTLVNKRNDLVQIEDKQLKESVHDEVHVQQVLSHTTPTKQSSVRSMVGWVRGMKSKLLSS